MKTLRTEILIDAPPEAVWRVLTQFETYPAWNPFIVNIQGARAEGGRLEVLIRSPGGSAMTFCPTIVRWEENKELRWKGRLLVPGIFDGEHLFRIEATASGGSRFFHGENFSGFLVPLIWKRLEPKTRAGFETMNNALKTVVESGIILRET